MTHEINLSRVVVLNIVGLTSRHIGKNMPFINDFLKRRDHSISHIRPVLPAVTSTVQATYLTGTMPQDHGIVSNIWYDRDYSEHRSWKQSNNLVKGEKIWEKIRSRHNPNYTCAKTFWWNNLYSSADYQITPRPIYRSDGEKIFDIQTWPMEMRTKIKDTLGEFPFSSFWGPLSGIKSSKWIGDSSMYIEENSKPDLQLVYLPHLDYNLQKYGNDNDIIINDLIEIDSIVRNLTTFFEEKGVSVIMLSEYGITNVNKPIHINRIFRKKGWISYREELGKEMIDLGNCKAFCISDHQFAHIYVNDKSILNEVRSTLEGIEGIKEVFSKEDMNKIGILHNRSGDFSVVSDEDKWFTYYYWEENSKAPDYATTVEIHKKIGYDPLELFFDPKIKFLKFKLFYKLIRKKLGFRTLMNLIPIDSNLIKGSHGCIPKDIKDYPVLIGKFSDDDQGLIINACDVHDKIYSKITT